jgi:hypothetical protein
VRIDDYPIADRFAKLKRGQSLGAFEKSEVTREEVASMTAGGEEAAVLRVSVSPRLLTRNPKRCTRKRTEGERLTDGQDG